jgi:RNA polymerase sigma-70 factor (ECF subfamily)
MRQIEQHLIQGIISKDKTAFDLLFRIYYSTFVYVSYDMLHDMKLAEDVVQDVFVKLWITGPNLSINTSLGAYLTGAVKNRCIDCLRAKNRRVETIPIENIEVQQKLHNLGTELSFDDNLFSSPVEIALNRALDQLSPRCRQIFVLNRFEGFSPGEIAEKMHISVNTVKVYITRALHKVKEAVSPYYRLK